MKVKRKARNEETYEKYETSPRKQLQKQDSTLRVLRRSTYYEHLLARF